MTDAASPRTVVAGSDAASIAAAGAAIRAGDLVAFPTETVYGLGGDATNGRAVAGIYAAKGRPSFNPLIVHVADLDAARRYADLDDRAERLAAAFWPGALTLVLPLAAGGGLSELVTAGLGSVAVRVPDHPVARALLAAAGRPLAAPSANRSGRVSPTTAAHVREDLDGRIAMIIDGGPTRVGLESTIVDLTRPIARLLRHGGIDRPALEAALGAPLDDRRVTNEVAPVAPGLLASHYAPAARVRLDAAGPNAGEAFLGFGPLPAGLAGPAETLSAAGDLTEAAANLFAALRRLDATGAAVIAVAPIPDEGLGEAINDRLHRAAAPRPEAG